MAEFSEELRRCLPAAVALGQADVREDLTAFPGEALSGARAARLAEFRAGRAAARRAMAQFGLAPAAVPVGPDRAPIWPEGLVGSISHCDGLCLALVAQAARVRGLGLDVEPRHDLPAEVWQTVLRPEEITEITALRADLQGIAALRRFVAKEAAYKAQYPISKRLFDFQTLRIREQGDAFFAEFQQEVPGFPCGTLLRGSLVDGCGFVAAVVVLPQTA